LAAVIALLSVDARQVGAAQAGISTVLFSGQRISKPTSAPLAATRDAVRLASSSTSSLSLPLFLFHNGKAVEWRTFAEERQAREWTAVAGSDPSGG
jgi:hypothetical protein